MWLRLDDGYRENPKIELLVDRAGLEGIGLHVSLMLYAARNLTDGYVPRIAAARAVVGSSPATLAALLELGLLHEVEGGYAIHDYLDFNPSASQVRATTAARSAAGRRGGKRSGKSRAEASAEASAQANPKQEPSKTRSKSSSKTEAKSNPVPVPVPVPDPTTEPSSSSASQAVDPWFCFRCHHQHVEGTSDLVRPGACARCGCKRIGPFAATDRDRDSPTYRPPSCRHCGSKRLRRNGGWNMCLGCKRERVLAEQVGRSDAVPDSRRTEGGSAR